MTHEFGPLPEPDGWAIWENYYPAKSTPLGAVRFAGADAERYTAEQVRAEVARAVAAERERCALVCEQWANSHLSGVLLEREPNALKLAAAIRAQAHGQTPESQG